MSDTFALITCELLIQDHANKTKHTDVEKQFQHSHYHAKHISFLGLHFPIISPPIILTFTAEVSLMSSNYKTGSLFENSSSTSLESIVV